MEEEGKGKEGGREGGEGGVLHTLRAFMMRTMAASMAMERSSC